MTDANTHLKNPQTTGNAALWSPREGADGWQQSGLMDGFSMEWMLTHFEDRVPPSKEVR